MAQIAFGICLGRELKRAHVVEISDTSVQKEKMKNTKPVPCYPLTSALQQLFQLKSLFFPVPGNEIISAKKTMKRKRECINLCHKFYVAIF